MTISRGFSLIESVIVIVVMGIAMLTITSFLVPQVSRSADPHYQTRAAAMGQSVMTKILARNFDNVIDIPNGVVTCDTSGVNQCTPAGSFGIDSGETNNNPDAYNDVDDFQGCWEPLATNSCRDLNLLVGGNSYLNFRVDVDVAYADVNRLKRIRLTVSASSQTPIVLFAYRGNY
ncbi:prepilin-type N-terminal cleavage/methylation domain-containing protein [Vibrio europaeus]|uniref:MSHA biogenesis protein MshD n=1 Tax=Vibrio europaeus TaxID=300876 RepID=A0A178JB56_9VIBR|nr:prepilin-type N-terminal cleavage/methylation domain-containing protein [Vibrio europaeus]MDC5703929.1 prepilin-type N-terminal cleavage/methylation domain-containing protein [Vibrio europaeus]MDC5708865.1 prepilin-type N-terminal cleavage/methylation domain-containing protein [Vibrio europaeus]MDC5713343.1 prepilin-type N-terminal cleavage/methylation domain-containing protein [Vibrio europaeus]MDC5719094.1 prepilin-type N-terminal cleavage/methylation domain-containing protein [Vibrio euro